MAFTRDDLAKLDAAIASGKLSVRHGDRAHQYQNLDAMIRARKEMLAEIESAEGKRKRRTFRVYQSGTGL
jgi:hypothetical protein